MNEFPKRQELEEYLSPYKHLTRIDKKFFLNIMNTIEDDYINQKVFQRLKNRQNKNANARQNFIELQDEFRNIFDS